MTTSRILKRKFKILVGNLKYKLFGCYIAYDAGCNTYTIEKYKKNVSWHNEVFRGTKKECEKEVLFQQNKYYDLCHNDSTISHYDY